jgi:hypothetical protein
MVIESNAGSRPTGSDCEHYTKVDVSVSQQLLTIVTVCTALLCGGCASQRGAGQRPPPRPPALIAPALPGGPTCARNFPGVNCTESSPGVPPTLEEMDGHHFPPQPKQEAQTQPYRNLTADQESMTTGS